MLEYRDYKRYHLEYRNFRPNLGSIQHIHQLVFKGNTKKVPSLSCILPLACYKQPVGLPEPNFTS